MRIADLFVPEKLEQELDPLIQAAHALDADNGYVLPASSSVSIKLGAIGPAGQAEDVLFVSGRNEKLGAIRAPGFLSFHSQALREMVASGCLDERLLGLEIRASQVLATSKAAPA